MTLERLHQMIKDGETLDVEFKGEERHPLNDRELVDTVVCLANRPGDAPGWLLVGIEDDGRITGARPRSDDGSIDPQRVQALIANQTRPSLTAAVSLIPIGDRDILVIEVPASRFPVGTAKGQYLRRAIGHRGEPECIPYHFHEMQSRQTAQGILDYSALALPQATWDDLDPIEFDRFRRSIRESRGRGDESLLQLSNEELAKALGAIEGNHAVRAVRVLGLLLFGHEESLRRLLPTHETAFQVLSGTQVQVNDFFRWPLLRSMEELLSRFRARNREQELMVGLLRVGVADYPERAFREAVANALIHRDYSQLGAVHIQWHDDRIEVSNPGGFPEGVRLDNLLVTPPRPRNLLLADAFKRAGIVERTARGIDTIFYEQLRSGRPAPSYERSTQNSVVLVLHGGKVSLEFVKLVVEENRADRLLVLDEVLLLNALWQERTLHTNRAAQLIQKPESEARSVLQRLVEAGLVEARGERKARAYHLSSATYRRLGQKAEYVRQRGFEPLQQEQMILQFVEKHGRITRKEVAELCQIGPYQASRLLTRLVRRQKLQKHGIHKNTWYELRSYL
jgi:ATP-dependent DNA helicase RecG